MSALQQNSRQSFLVLYDQYYNMQCILKKHDCKLLLRCELPSGLLSAYALQSFILLLTGGICEKNVLTGGNSRLLQT